MAASVLACQDFDIPPSLFVALNCSEVGETVALGYRLRSRRRTGRGSDGIAYILPPSAKTIVAKMSGSVKVNFSQKDCLNLIPCAIISFVCLFVCVGFINALSNGSVDEQMREIGIKRVLEETDTLPQNSPCSLWEIVLLF